MTTAKKVTEITRTVIVTLSEENESALLKLAEEIGEEPHELITDAVNAMADELVENRLARLRADRLAARAAQG